ncbi:SURF1 family protein [Altererythrobacter xixiisoli]|uniref:SURF1-like protein n=1 Tax=Croceibacterium xixiisoli TaxID=1476466 RepID=A0A6I4TWR6_9SPHN|nr:SURF1 family protein [Croceibacterium xixiisoli]MXO99649.1 SURF1 family protein [Croceibacterium xixiisoli]
MRQPLKIPVLPTIFVLIAVAIMIALGVWQLQRSEWKAALLNRYAAAQTLPQDAAWPRNAQEQEERLYRHTSLACVRVLGFEAIAGRSARGESGWAHVARCQLPNGAKAPIALGWSRDPASPEWTGGTVGGFIAPAGEEVRLVAEPAQAGLEQLARPDPADLPNNHMSYAVQWFLFAVTALVIYAIALVQKARKGQA